MTEPVSGLHRIRGSFVTCHVLVDGPGRATIVDTGFIGHPGKFKRAFAELALSPQDVDANTANIRITARIIEGDMDVSVWSAGQHWRLSPATRLERLVIRGRMQCS